MRKMATAFHYQNSSGCEARDVLLPTTSPNWRDWVEFNKTVTRNEGVHPSVDPARLRSNVTPCFKEFQMFTNFTVAGLGCVTLHFVASITLSHQCTCFPKTACISVQFWGNFCFSSFQNVPSLSAVPAENAWIVTRLHYDHLFPNHL